MRAIVEGTLLEKVEIDRDIDGKQVKKKVFMLYQRGEKINPQVTVDDKTFAKYQEGEKVSLITRVRPYAFGNVIGLSIIQDGV